MPLYFFNLNPSRPYEVVAWRIVLSLVFCAILITLLRGWHELRMVTRNRRITITMLACGLLISLNWSVYVFAALSHQILQSALGYFINPIITIVLGVFLLHEKLRRIQWFAVALAGAAVLVLTLSYGQIPWISLLLASSFGCYGLLKKQIGGQITAIQGFTLETMWVVPIAVVTLTLLATSGSLTAGTVSVAHTVLLSLAGVITAIPLLLFAAGASRLSLSGMGFVQFCSPILQFLVAAFILHEQLPSERWLGFALVWLAMLVICFDLYQNGRRNRAPHR